MHPLIYKLSSVPYIQAVQCPFIQAVQCPFIQAVQCPFIQAVQCPFIQAVQCPFSCWFLFKESYMPVCYHGNVPVITLLECYSTLDKLQGDVSKILSAGITEKRMEL
jgi:hypothetical protein